MQLGIKSIPIDTYFILAVAPRLLLSNRITDTGKIEVRNLHGGHYDRRAHRTVLRGGDAHGWPEHLHILQHLCQRLIEAEIRYRSRDPAVLDQEGAITREAGIGNNARVESADVPEAREQYSALC